MLKFFDTHCQLQFPQYDADRAEVLERMRAGGVGGLVIGTDYEMSKAATALAETQDFLWASVGCHPNHEEVFDVRAYEHLASHRKVVAVGECGLDYFRSDKTGQREKFLAHIELAQRLGKTLVVHCRDPLRRVGGEASAHDDCLEILRTHKLSAPVVIHFFTSTADVAKQYLDLGCYLSFPGPITFTDMYDESIALCPMDKLLIETDAPFAAPTPYRGKRNEPVYVVEVARKIAAVKGMSLEEVAAQTTKNAHRALGLPAGKAGIA